jgi:hypothetical protein
MKEARIRNGAYVRDDGTRDLALATEVVASRDACKQAGFDFAYYFSVRSDTRSDTLFSPTESMSVD